MKRAAVLVVMVAVVCGSVLAADVRKLSFSPEDPEALVLVEERDGIRGGTMKFVQVDLAAMTRGTIELTVDKTTRGRLRTADRGLQTKGEGLLVPKNMSRFSAAKGAPGDYALIDFSWNDGIGVKTSAPRNAIPVYRFVAGKANLVTAEMLPLGGGSSNILSYAAARNGSNDDVGDAQKILGEYPSLRATVVPAEVVAYIRFDGKNVVRVER
jgi:hypothetical protein